MLQCASFSTSSLSHVVFVIYSVYMIYYTYSFSFFLNCNLLFYIGVQLIDNTVIVSGVQQSDSYTHIHPSLLFLILFTFRLLGTIEQSSLCYGFQGGAGVYSTLYYTVAPCQLSVLNITMCSLNSKLPNYHSP